jgi:6-phosphogluconolactonase (cycloisomerase 2 family)
MPACRLPPQPEIAAFSKDSSTGGSSLIPSSPTLDQLEGGSMAVDALGRFLFVPDPATSKISMFQIDRNTGALNEVPASPFSAVPTENPKLAPTSPMSIATEASGQFLYVGYAFGNFVGQSSVNAFLIDSTNLQLLPLPVQSTTDIDSPPIGLFADPKGRYLYAGSGANLVHEYSERHNERLQD